LPPFEGPGLGALGWVPPYRKTLPLGAADYENWIGDLARAVFTARRDGRLVGFLAVAPHWTGYALIHELAVDLPARHGGIARRLMDQAVLWARAQGLAGLRLETQSNNVPACRFYRRYGFQLGGHDEWLYRALEPGTREVALFWYLPF
jgi:ribosomal protein S18 acetylase RimI-like enzyme